VLLLQSIEKRVKDSASEIDAKEWDNISQFLRQVYQGNSIDRRGCRFFVFLERSPATNVSSLYRTNCANLLKAGDDMKSIAGGIFDPDKKTRALADSESLKKYAKATDLPVSKQDGEAFLTAAVKMDELFEDFLDQLRDVPDL
jgi:hypothetical protein